MPFDDEARWALPRDGNAGGESSLAVSPPSSSSSDGGGDTSRMTGAMDSGVTAAVAVSNENQLRR